MGNCCGPRNKGASLTPENRGILSGTSTAGANQKSNIPQTKSSEEVWKINTYIEKLSKSGNYSRLQSYIDANVSSIMFQI